MDYLIFYKEPEKNKLCGCKGQVREGGDDMADDRLIVALDVHTFDEVKTLVNDLGEIISYYKVGMELYYSVGRGVIDFLSECGKKIFLDLKLHDIPNTVGEGLASLMVPGVTMMNVHASGGYSMLARAAEKIRSRSGALGIESPKLIAVTVLTSISPDEWKEMGNDDTIKERVVRLAKLVKSAGLDGVVASVEEAAAIREACGEGFIIVTPGIRPAGAMTDDQSRIATPRAAIENGATHIVVGRPIRAADDPKAAVKKIIEEMRQAS